MTHEQLQMAGKIVGERAYRYEYIPAWGKFPKDLYNNSVGVDSEDRVYALGLGIGKTYPLAPAPLIEICNRDGDYLGNWGSGAAVHAHGLNIIDDVVYVCDKPASVCLKYTLDGKILQLLGRHGVHSDTGCMKSGDPVPRAAGPFNRPDDFVRAPWGDFYVADGTHNARVHRFDGGGNLIQSWGHWGHEPGQFSSPHSVLPTRDGRLYVCDRLNDRVQIFTPDGVLIGIWTGFQWPSKIVLTPEGDFAVCEDPGNQTNPGVIGHGIETQAARPSGIRIVNKDGKLISHLAVGRTHWIAQDSYGDIYTATHTAINKLARVERLKQPKDKPRAIYPGASGGAPYVPASYMLPMHGGTGSLPPGAIVGAG